MHDEMATAKSAAYEEAGQYDEVKAAPRIPMEFDSLEKQIEHAAITAEQLVERLASVMRPESPDKLMAADGVPQQEPSQHAARLVASRSRVARIERLLSDALERLEI